MAPAVCIGRWPQSSGDACRPAPSCFAWSRFASPPYGFGRYRKERAMNDKANWERVLHPNRGQVVLIKSRGYWATMDLYVRRVDKNLGWKVRLDRPVLGSDTVRVSEIL